MCTVLQASFQFWLVVPFVRWSIWLPLSAFQSPCPLIWSAFRAPCLRFEFDLFQLPILFFFAQVPIVVRIFLCLLLTGKNWMSTWYGYGCFEKGCKLRSNGNHKLFLHYVCLIVFFYLCQNKLLELLVYSRVNYACNLNSLTDITDPGTVRQFVRIFERRQISIYIEMTLSESYCQNFRGGSFGQVEAVDVAKWRQKLI